MKHITFLEFVIERYSKRFVLYSLQDMTKCGYRGSIEEWFNDLYTEYNIMYLNA